MIGRVEEECEDPCTSFTPVWHPLGAYSSPVQSRDSHVLRRRLRLVMLRCDVLASCPIDQLAATVANPEEGFENAGVRSLGLWDCVSIFRDADLMFLLTTSKQCQDKSFLAI